MSLRSLRPLLLLIPALWAGACRLEQVAPPPSKSLEVKVTVAWTAIGGGDSNQAMSLVDGAIYWADYINGGIGATSTVTGETLWYNSQIGPTQSNTLVTGRGVWVQSNWATKTAPRLFLLDKSTGSLLHTVTLPSADYHVRMFAWTRTDTALVWHAAGVGLVSLEEAHVTEGEAAQSLTPTTLWPGVYGHISLPLWHNKKLYFQLRKADDWIESKSDGDDILVFDPATKSVLKRLVTAHAGANDQFAPAVYQNKIFYQDWNALKSIDPATDALGFTLTKDIDRGSGAGFAFYEDKLYFSNANGGTTEDYDRNLICRSTVDGHEVWKAFADNYSLGNRPVVKDGVLYLMTQTGFKLFNANTGALIGFDKRIHSSGGDIFDNTLDDGTYLYPRAMGKIYAIKMDFKLDANGGLTR